MKSYPYGGERQQGLPTIANEQPNNVELRADLQEIVAEYMVSSRRMKQAIELLDLLDRYDVQRALDLVNALSE